MKILNAIERLRVAQGDTVAFDATATEGLSILLRLIAPIAPHIAHRLWRDCGFGEDVLLAPWPEPDEAALEQDEVELVVQVNGAKRGSIRVPKSAGKEAIEALALANSNVQKFVSGQAVKKFVLVPGRLINLVV
jgi:leucyl-tRNA synthetase